MSDISVVIIHIGYRDYLRCNLEITGKNNSVYLIGDESTKHLGCLKNVSFVNINKYINSEKIAHYKKYFVNYSSNSADLEFLCFVRIFIIQQFLIDNNLKHIIHIDSDNILLKNVNDLFFTEENAYVMTQNSHINQMSNSIHVGLLSSDFCIKFEALYNDIYVNKSKLPLIEDKIMHHSAGDGKYINGGICDMTLYYLLHKTGMIKVQNLCNPMVINDKKYVFIDNANNGVGGESQNQYELENNVMKFYKSEDGKDILVYDTFHKEFYVLCNIHFQGPAKRLLNTNFILGLLWNW